MIFSAKDGGGERLGDGCLEAAGKWPEQSSGLEECWDGHTEQVVGAVRYSSDLGVSRLSDLDAAFPAHSEFDHCMGTPVRSSSSNQLLDNRQFGFARRNAERKEIPKHDLRLDRLSEREKKRIIENLVKIQKDGTVEVDVGHSASIASDLLELDAAYEDGDSVASESVKSIPRLNIAILVVGTRGDVQPFLAIAKRLQEFGHRVRLATHVIFRNFVKSAGVEYYPLAGDPRILTKYMVKTGGFVLSGLAEMAEQRNQLKAIINSLLPACTEPDLDSGSSFRAQAIIANPPAYGHVHVAEALGVPLHMFFTFPWTPTREFAHPLAPVQHTAANRLSYLVVELIVWWGIRTYINEFRTKRLKLPPIAYFSTYRGSISHLPTGYMWSSLIAPKPKDWGPLIDVVGYCFLNLEPKYRPQKEIVDWIKSGSQPIYVGFGSVPVKDPEKITVVILNALKETGQRGIIGHGWGDLGTLTEEVTEDIYLMAGDCPHDWLFPQCAAVVHHGGAGTTATGLRAGCPTTIIPFFGDQFFWADRIHERGVGPASIPISELSVERLAQAILFMLEPEVKSRAIELAKQRENEDGVATAVDAFHRHLPSELPLPRNNISDDDDEQHSSLKWLFAIVERWCCLPCFL